MAVVRLIRVRGSSPRGEGTAMYVSSQMQFGTIGGGRLEHMAVAVAREILCSGKKAALLDVPLGREIGQCCGGRVEVEIFLMDEATRATALHADAQSRLERPAVLIFGAGHVGRALAEALAPLPFATSLIDSRVDELAQATVRVVHHLTPLPEAILRDAAPGAAHVVMTHDHALDFLLTAEALKRRDARYIGLIGSATKRVRFERFAAEHDIVTEGLTCPIGAGGSGDKRPELIAAFAAAEIAATLTG
ncbi:xanthine dehydrogenase accessory protein XdhC [Palleronia abyssalis]|nr:xanthine dehydrogenase accessory protein XdhC [Palleronia abyssalis]